MLSRGRVALLARRAQARASSTATPPPRPKLEPKGSNGKLFDKILIANRGEISCRVSRTAHKLGIKTVAIYSDPDVNSLHVRYADEAVCVGPAPSSQSYLSIPRILDAIQKTGAQAVHPGYGFLSENSKFVEELDKAGVTFIGPGVYAMDALGDKIHSKQLAMKAGVSTVPGFLGDVPNADEAVRISREIGYPVMIKASSGGGGKGMRIAYNDEEARMGYRLSKEEARSAFASDVVFVEKYIEEPRHIEIQLIADSHGNVVPLPERECTIQRRNQKVIEESPSPFLDPATRKAMQDQAASLALSVGYVSAGTVEFLVDKHKQFYFLEMNTRLQVEHPVTEMVTGLDLVELMLRVAAGEKLPSSLLGAPVPIQGHAFESRVYAEDPFRGFLPSTGRLAAYTEPGAFAHRDAYLGPQYDFHSRAEPTDEEPNPVTPDGVLRADAGVTRGSEISMFYDPMICKLISHDTTRAGALDKMRAALDAYVIRGVGHNISFLRELCDHPKFAAGVMDTGFIKREYPDGFKGVKLSETSTARLVAAAAVMQGITELARTAISGRSPHAAAPETDLMVVTVGKNEAGADGSAPALRHFAVLLNESPMEEVAQTPADYAAFEELPQGDAVFRAAFIKEIASADAIEKQDIGSSDFWQTDYKQVQLLGTDWTADSDLFLACLGKPEGEEKEAGAEERRSECIMRVQQIARTPTGFQLAYLGATVDVAVRTQEAFKLARHMVPKRRRDLSKALVSPMPGTLISVAVADGQEVEEGQEVAVVEAMKMQNVLRAPRKSTVKKVAAKPGSTLAVDQVIVEFQ